MVVLTAGHCIMGPTTFTVKVGAESRTTTGSAVYDWTTVGDFINPAQHDIALLFLSKPIWLRSYPTIEPTAVPANTPVTNVGRMHNGVTWTLWGADVYDLNYGTMIGAAPPYSGTFAFDDWASNVLEPGDSGGPVFIKDTDPHRIVAVNSGSGTLGSGKQIELLARVDLLHGWIMQQIVAHPAPAPTNADLLRVQLGGGRVSEPLLAAGAGRPAELATVHVSPLSGDQQLSGRRVGERERPPPGRHVAQQHLSGEARLLHGSVGRRGGPGDRRLLDEAGELPLTTSPGHPPLQGRAFHARSAAAGGNVQFESLDAERAEGRYQAEPSHDLTPERLYERAFAENLLHRVLDQVREKYAAAGKSALFDELKGTLTASASRDRYEEVAARLGRSEGDVRKAAFDLRGVYKKMLLAEVESLVDVPPDAADAKRVVDDEIGYLLLALAG
ncbi:trypsin-like serine protease [Polyangium mundeleinium]|uniref:Trypsin-like serine protease n=1 Tax=Polyangium mundeleinium TaxID=2995306 RepID=A0ABT5EN94_9BACT|nr:trypsin-like serine protease [Polyangium mundeleinium]MDC0743310.1 trypsin-like serine protease [Polyangium mundeleinium]